MDLSPCVSLTFNGNCEAAFRFYERVLGGRIVFTLKWGQSPMGKDAPPEWQDKVLYQRMSIGSLSIAAGDAVPGTYVAPAGFSLMLNVGSVAEGERLFAALAENGHVRMPLQETFWAAGYGQVADQFGIPWEINCDKG
jgi:PhnB protein